MSSCFRIHEIVECIKKMNGIELRFGAVRCKLHKDGLVVGKRRSDCDRHPSVSVSFLS